ncbi:PucR family transcriptional regulator [uncultured Cetobacterium sp.]|uniref:PucR family transcriptional regulator n=1 Tax=uncultured Cetobacterium sp. TaxID=527638 RepID=UPI00260B94CB|nr:PucR family transcriptional regulator [uncultured Cetobacterium sp.]
MFFRCMDLFNIESFKQAKLISGEEGAYKEISWPYIKTTDSIRKWVNGKELLFILYDNENSNLYDLLKEAINKNLSGIVILTNFTEEIITNDLIELSNKHKFPLFLLPWNIKLLNLTQEIILAIQKYSTKNLEAQKIFRELLNSDKNYYKNLNKFYNINICNYNFLGIFEDKDNENIENFYNHYFDIILKQLFLKNFIKKDEIIYFTYSNRIVFLIFIDNIEKANKIRTIIENILKKFILKYKNLYLAFSKINKNNVFLKHIFDETEEALNIGKNNKNSNQIIYYENIGIYKIFIEMINNENIKKHCFENINVLLEYDLKNNTNLFETLKVYFNNNRHLVNTSNELYIHRNTLIYRLNIIKTLLKKDLNNALENLELYNSILFYEFNYFH